MTTDDPWYRLRRFTNARIGLGRAGDALPTRHLLAFRLAHARARDSVYSELDSGALIDTLKARMPDLPACLTVTSEASDRADYLQRPDHGRRLAARCRESLPAGHCDLVLVIGDGLSADAVTTQAPALLAEAWPALSDLSRGPLVVATQARVALADDIGERMGAKLVVMLIGERPGLSSPASLGIYLTWQPRVGRQNSERNCISNIHDQGLSPAIAAVRLVALIRTAMARQLTGVGLKAPDGLPDTPPTDRLEPDRSDSAGAGQT